MSPISVRGSSVHSEMVVARLVRSPQRGCRSCGPGGDRGPGAARPPRPRRSGSPIGGGGAGGAGGAAALRRRRTRRGWALSSLSLTQTSLLQLSSIAIGLTQRAGTSGERRAHWLRGARRSCSDYHISAPPPPCATDRAARPRDGLGAPALPRRSPPGRSGLGLPLRLPRLLPPPPSLLPGRAAGALAAGRAAPPPSAPGVPARRVARRAHFLPPRASGWWVGLPEDEVRPPPPRVLAKGPLGTARLAGFDLAPGPTAPGLAAPGCPGG